MAAILNYIVMAVEWSDHVLTFDDKKLKTDRWIFRKGDAGYV
jgi:hypothetical protein